MKVFRITNSLDYGGIERVFELHAKYHRKDYELVLVALGHGGKAEAVLRTLGNRVIILSVNSKIPSWESFKTLFALFRIERPDVVHTSGAEANFHGLLAAFLANVPRRVGEEIGIPSRSAIARLVFKLVFLLAHKVIAISYAVRQYLKGFEVLESKVCVVYNPIDLVSHHSTYRKSHDSFRVSFVGRLEPIKNLSILMDLLKRLEERYPKRAFELWLIGEGSQREYLMNYSKLNGVSSSVKFIGYVEEPWRLLVQTDVFILPSFFEGFGLACIESIQYGVPVIVSNSGGMVEYITNDINGFLFDPQSLEELLLKTELLLSMDEDKLKAMTSKASSTINEMFSPDKYLSALNQIYFPLRESHSIG